MEKSFKILSLDGGGSWAILQLLTLKEIYPGKKGHEILQEFDLVIANSGGAIALAGLCCNWTTEKTIDLFNKEEMRKKVFHKLSFWDKYFPTGITSGLGIGARYSTTKKYAAFNEIFAEIKDIPMKKLPEYIGKKDLKIIVCTFDAMNNKSKFFKSMQGDQLDNEFDSVNLIKAVHAASNAPVNYFDFPAKFKADGTEKYYYAWDGALGGFNNPVAAGLIEAIKCSVPKNNIAVLSIGTGKKLMTPSDKKYFYKLYINVLKHRKLKPLLAFKFFKNNVMNLAKTILYEPPDWANYVAYIMRFEPNITDVNNIKKFVRLNPMIYCKDDASVDLKKLVYKLHKMDMDIIKQDEIDAIQKCFVEWKIGNLFNQPITSKMTSDDTFIPDIGHTFFNDAILDWKQII